MASHHDNSDVFPDQESINLFGQSLGIYNNGQTFNDQKPGPDIDEIRYIVAQHHFSMSKKGNGTLPSQNRLDFIIRSLQHLAEQPGNKPGKLSDEQKLHLVPLELHGSCPQWFNRVKTDYEYFAIPKTHPLTGRLVHGLYRTLAPKDVEICEEVTKFKEKGSATMTEQERLRGEKAMSIAKCHHPVAPVEELYNMLAAAHGVNHRGRDKMYAELTSNYTKTFPKELCAEFIKLCKFHDCADKAKALATAVDKRNSTPRQKAETKTQKFGLKEGRVTKRAPKDKKPHQGSASTAAPINHYPAATPSSSSSLASEASTPANFQEQMHVQQYQNAYPEIVDGLNSQSNYQEDWTQSEGIQNLPPPNNDFDPQWNPEQAEAQNEGAQNMPLPLNNNLNPEVNFNEAWYGDHVQMYWLAKQEALHVPLPPNNYLDPELTLPYLFDTDDSLNGNFVEEKFEPFTPNFQQNSVNNQAVQKGSDATSYLLGDETSPWWETTPTPESPASSNWNGGIQMHAPQNDNQNGAQPNSPGMIFDQMLAKNLAGFNK